MILDRRVGTDFLGSLDQVVFRLFVLSQLKYAQPSESR